MPRVRLLKAVDGLGAVGERLSVDADTAQAWVDEGRAELVRSPSPKPSSPRTERAVREAPETR